MATNPTLSIAVERDRVVRHFFGDSDSLKGSVGNLLALDSDARLIAQLFLFAEHAQLRADASEQLARIKRL